MIELNKEYQKKSNGCKIIPFKIDNDGVHYHSVGYSDWRICPIEIFTERFEIVPENLGIVK